MSPIFRVILIVVSLLTTFYILKKIRQSKLQIEYMDLIDALFCDVNPIPVKEALNLMGMEAGPVRLPLCELSEKNHERLRAAMAAKGLL